MMIIYWHITLPWLVKPLNRSFFIQIPIIYCQKEKNVRCAQQLSSPSISFEHVQTELLTTGKLSTSSVTSAAFLFYYKQYNSVF